jgi:hypothetical protein
MRLRGEASPNAAPSGPRIRHWKLYVPGSVGAVIVESKLATLQVCVMLRRLAAAVPQVPASLALRGLRANAPGVHPIAPILRSSRSPSRSVLPQERMARSGHRSWKRHLPPAAGSKRKPGSRSKFRPITTPLLSALAADRSLQNRRNLTTSHPAGLAAPAGTSRSRLHRHRLGRPVECAG